MSRRLLLVGRGITRSLSPALHAPLLARGARDVEYSPLDLPESDFAAGVRAALDDPALAGMNVTIPYKSRIAAFLDDLDDSARAACGAVNCVYPAGGAGRRRWIGGNTDGTGFLVALARHGFAPAGVRAGILGAGGAAAAVARALLAAGAAQVRLFNRTRDRADALARALDDPRAVPVDAAEDLSGCALLVHATPARPPEVPDAALSGARLFVDLNTSDLSPELPPRLARRGVAYADGAETLVAQAAFSHPLWFGGRAPLDELRAIYYNCIRRGSPLPSSSPE